MASFNISGDELVTCPYDPVHRLKKSRMQMHLVKCAKNHPEIVLRECPFNHTHRMAEGEYQHHLLNCPQRHKVDRMVGANIDRNNPFKGHTGVPSYSTEQDLPEPIESWENEISSVPAAGYVPPTEVPRGGIIHDLGLTKPSERKMIYQKLSLAANEEKTNGIVRIPGLSPTKVLAKDPEPRKPKQRYEEAFKASMLRNGNGVSGKSDSRIAANIFPQSQTIVSQDMQNPGIGRGRGNPGIAYLKSYENDFPVLGMGRGNPVKK